MKPFTSLPLLFTTAFGLATPRCRCLYGQACWPSAADFSVLASSLSQPLVAPLPSYSACYPPSNASANCEINSLTLRIDRPGSMVLDNFETFIFDNGTINACYSNSSLGTHTCEQGNVPVVGVDARSVADIRNAVNFASAHNLRLVVKNTGHCLLGRSAGRGAFSVWTHHMKNITYNEAFVAQGAPASEVYNAITLEAGVQWGEAYDVVQAHGRVLVGGLSGGGTVGAAGGWLLGGGHSMLSPWYGLGVDNVIEISIVTSTGDYLTVNSHQHSDLFWALRGGGGGTFGVVTSVTYQTHPPNPFVVVGFSANSTNPSAMKKLVTEFVRIHPALTDAGFSGYSSTSNVSMAFAYAVPNVSEATANKTLDSFFAYAQNLTSEGVEIEAGTTSFKSFYDFYAPFRVAPGNGTAGGIVEFASRLIPRKLFEDDYKKLAETLFDVNGGISWNYVGGGAVSRVNPDSTGLNPAWRKALVHAVFSTTWDEGASFSEIEQARAELAARLKKVSDEMPDAGSYFNEASLYEINPQEVFFGSHYEKLKSVKNAYDPIGLFVVAEGVGSDDWDKDLTCRR